MLQTIPGEAILAQMNWRYGAKAFSDQRISDLDWKTLTETLRLAPSSFGLQPWRFVIVSSPEVREQLAESAPLNRSKIMSCSHLLLVAHLKTVSTAYIDRHFDYMAEVRGVPPASIQSFRDMMMGRVTGQSAEAQRQWTARQAYTAVGAFVTAAALLGIDACPMEGIDPAKFDSIVGLTETDYATVVGIAAGYRSPDDKTQFAKKVRFDYEDMFTTV